MWNRLLLLQSMQIVIMKSFIEVSSELYVEIGLLVIKELSWIAYSKNTRLLFQYVRFEAGKDRIMFLHHCYSLKYLFCSLAVAIFYCRSLTKFLYFCFSYYLKPQHIIIITILALSNLLTEPSLLLCYFFYQRLDIRTRKNRQEWHTIQDGVLFPLISN